MNGLNSCILGKEQPSCNCTLPSSLLLLPQQKQTGVKMHVCFLLVQNSVWFFFFSFPSELSLINSLKHLTLHRSSRHTSTCPSASSVCESSLLQMGQMADTRGCSVNFGKICCSAAHSTALLTKPRLQTVSGKLRMAQPQTYFGQRLPPTDLPACSASGLEISIFLALIPWVPVIPWNWLLV